MLVNDEDDGHNVGSLDDACVGTELIPVTLV